MPELTYGSLFSGVEGFGLGFEEASFTVKWQVEKDAFCKKVLARHWPKVKRYADVKRVGAKQLERVHVITAGVPCQDVSIAGKRAGLSGARTGLFYHFARILQELRPAWFVFENVPGLFSSNEGRDFAEVLRVLMVECGYGVSWRVLDSRYFNVAQRRERVFIVGRFGEPCPAEILFESESGGGDPQKSGEARSDIAVPLTSGSGVTGHKPGRRQEDDFNIVASAIVSRIGKGGFCDPVNDNVIASTIRSEYGEQAYRGDGSDNFVFESRFARNGRGGPSSIVPPLKAESGGTGKGDGAPLVCFDTTQLTHPDNRSNPQPGGPCHPLAAGAHPPTVARCLDGHHRQVRAENGNYVIGDPRGTVGTINHLDHQHGTQDAVNGLLVRSTPPDADGVRDFARLPQGLDSARYRALGNAVTASVSYWIAKRIAAWEQARSEN